MICTGLTEEWVKSDLAGPRALDWEREVRIQPSEFIELLACGQVGMKDA